MPIDRNTDAPLLDLANEADALADAAGVDAQIRAVLKHCAAALRAVHVELTEDVKKCGADNARADSSEYTPCAVPGCKWPDEPCVRVWGVVLAAPNGSTHAD